MEPRLIPCHLRCECPVNPMGVDTKTPRLNWVVESDENGQAQNACRIMAATSQSALAAG